MTQPENYVEKCQESLVFKLKDFIWAQTIS